MNPMSLAINSDNGKRSAQDQIRAMQIVYGPNAQFNFAHTPLEGDLADATVDGVIHREGRIVGVGEIKTRYNITHEGFLTKFNGEWLITLTKLWDSKRTAVCLRVPAYGFIFIPDSRLVMALPICDALGNWTCKFREQQFETKESCNGGKANRWNAFVDVRNAMIYREQ